MIVLVLGTNPGLGQTSATFSSDPRQLKKNDPAAVKKLLVEEKQPGIFLPAWHIPFTALEAASGNLKVIVFYYLMHVGEYTCNITHTTSKNGEIQKLKMRLSCITRMDDSNNCHEMHRLS
jgi:hypothetical protein